jgi:hypothetical protein
MKSLRTLLCLLIIGVSAQAQIPTINCDSLIKEFDKEITNAKKAGNTAKEIEYLESIKKQFVDMYCNNKTEPQINKPKPTVQPSGNSKTIINNFNTAHKITISYSGVTNQETQKGTLAYYIEKNGKSILLTESSFISNKEFQSSFFSTEDGKLDGWVMNDDGSSILFVTTKEEGKVSMQQKLPSESNNNEQGTIKVKNLQTIKNIAGYDCTLYNIQSNSNGEQANFNCWITNKDFPITAPSKVLFPIYTAQLLQVPNAGKRVALSVEGINGSEKLNYTIQKIETNNQQFSFSGYKPMNISSY